MAFWQRVAMHGRARCIDKEEHAIEPWDSKLSLNQSVIMLGEKWKIKERPHRQSMTAATLRHQKHRPSGMLHRRASRPPRYDRYPGDGRGKRACSGPEEFAGAILNDAALRLRTQASCGAVGSSKNDVTTLRAQGDAAIVMCATPGMVTTTARERVRAACLPHCAPV
jgi:hypothetical protein